MTDGSPDARDIAPGDQDVPEAPANTSPCAEPVDAAAKRNAAIALFGLVIFLGLLAIAANVEGARNLVGLWGIVGLGVAAAGTALVFAGSGSSVRETVASLVGGQQVAVGPPRPGLRRVGVIVLSLGMAGAVVGAVLTSIGPDSPAFVAASSASTNGQRILRIDRPAHTDEGDVMIAQVHGRGKQAVVAPPGWTRIDGIVGSGDNMEAFWKVATGDEPGFYDFDGQHPDGKGGGITSWSGVDSAAPISGWTRAELGADSRILVPAVTTSAPDTPLIMMVGVIADPAVRLPPDMTTQWTVTSPPGEFVSTTACATVIQSSMGSTGDKAGSAGEGIGYGGWVAMLIALRPVSDDS